MPETKKKLAGLFGDQLQTAVPLANFTTWKIGGPAEYFLVADNNEELVKAVKAAVDLKIPYLILGGGSNLLVADKGFAGLVIKAQNDKYQLIKEGELVKIYAESGMPLARLIGEAAGKNLSGLEWAVGIPGTVGGAVRGNAGAFGKAFGEVVESVSYLRGGKLKKALTKDCQFAYRSSIFKNSADLVILGAVVNLAASRTREEILAEMKKTVVARKDNYPAWPNAGCVFKNILVDEKLMMEWQKNNPEFLNFIKGNKFPTAKLIESCDLKGKTIGQAQVWERHANYIVNLGSATAEEVIMLISFIKQQVRDRYGIQLQEEIEMAGF